MPIYEYSCNKCGEEFEYFIHQLYDDKPKCPVCGSMDLERLMSAATAIFKESGFHKTDYDKNGRKK